MCQNWSDYTNGAQCTKIQASLLDESWRSFTTGWVHWLIFSTTVTESSNGCRSCPRSTGSNSGIFHTSINLWTLGWFHWEGTWHNTSHIFTLFIYSFVGRERAVKKYEFWFYARFHQHNQLLKSPASRFSFFRPILWIFWSYCRLYCVNANPSHYHQPHSPAAEQIEYR